MAGNELLDKSKEVIAYWTKCMLRGDVSLIDTLVMCELIADLLQAVQHEEGSEKPYGIEEVMEWSLDKALAIMQSGLDRGDPDIKATMELALSAIGEMDEPKTEHQRKLAVRFETEVRKMLGKDSAFEDFISNLNLGDIN